MAQILALKAKVPALTLPLSQTVEAVELYLLGQPWKSEETRERYQRVDKELRLDLDRSSLLERIDAMREGRDKAVALDIFQGAYSGGTFPDRYEVAGGTQ